MSRVALSLCVSGLLLALAYWKAPLAQSLPCSLAEKATVEGQAERAFAALDLCLETAALSDEQRARAHVARGLLFLKDARIDCALADFDRAIWLAPAHAAAYVARGEASLKKAFDPVANPNGADCRSRHSRPHIGAGSTIQESKAGGARVAGQYFSSRREAERWLQQQRQIANLQRQVEELQRQLAPQQASSPQDKEALLPRDAPLQAPGEVTRGLADFSRALQLSPDLSAALIGRAAAHCLLGQGEAAQADWRRFLAQNPMQVSQFQRELSEIGFYSGAVDGLVGPQSRAALAAFAEARCR